MAVAAENAYEILKQRVVAGAYSPGAQLKEEPIARELGISRTPVRAALKRLVDDGLATADPNRGVRVAFSPAMTALARFSWSVRVLLSRIARLVE